MPRLRVDQWLLLVWLAGVLAVLEWTLIDRVRVFFLAQRARDVTDARREVFQRQVLRLGVEGPVRFVEADLELPMTWGVVDVAVAVPIASREWPEERLEAVLLHELAHVRRRDTLTQLIAQVACAVYWFHPLVWFAARQLRVLREYACDDEVITHGVRPSSYAEELLELVQNVKRRDSLSGATLAMARRSHFKERLLAMLDPTVQRARLARTRAWSMAALAAVLTVSVVVVQPAAAEPPAKGTLPRLTPKQAQERQVTSPEASAPLAPLPAPVAAPLLPRSAPVAPASPEAPEAPEAPDAPASPVAEECDDGAEAEVRAKIDAAVRSSKDDSSLATALKRIAHEEDLDEELTRQTYLAASARLKDDLARWIALEALLIGAPISEQTAAGVMSQARRFTRDAERVAFLHRMNTIREDELVRGPYATDYLDLAATLQTQEALSDALRELLHPNPVAPAVVERALGMAATLDGDLLAPVLIEVTDHQALTGNVPALYAARVQQLDGRARADALARWDETGGGAQRFAFADAPAREAMKEYQRIAREAVKQARDELRRQAEERRREAAARRDLALQQRDYARQLEQLQREKERIKARAEQLKHEAIELDSALRELKKSFDGDAPEEPALDLDLGVE